MPKSSTAICTPSSFRPLRTATVRSRLSTSTPSVSSSSRLRGASPDARRARSTVFTKPGLRNCRAETFTARRSSADPASPQTRICRQLSASANAPSGWIKSESSATGMNCPGEIGREHRKGVSTEPRHGVAFAYGALQAVGDHSQQRIARAAAVALVDQLEAIQVQDQQRRRPARAPGVRDRLQGAVAEQVAVRQAGQRIVVRQLLQPRFVGLSLPYVPRDSGEKAYLPAGAPLRDG